MKRYQEIDTIRGFSVILMVFYHYFYIKYLMNISNEIDVPLIDYCGKISHNIFIFLVGLNLFINYKKNKDKEDYKKKKITREINLFTLGLIITLITYLIFPDKFIRFGILHFISLSSVFSSLFLSSILKTSIGIVIFTALNYIIDNHLDKLFSICKDNIFGCFILGANFKYSSIDHFSFIPNFITILLGILFGQIFYKNDNNNKFKNIKNKPLELIGKESLRIYMLHWVILYLIIKNT